MASHHGVGSVWTGGMSSLGSWYCDDSGDGWSQVPVALLIPSGTSPLSVTSFTRVRRHVWFCMRLLQRRYYQLMWFQCYGAGLGPSSTRSAVLSSSVASAERCCQLHRAGWTPSWASQVKPLHSLTQFFHICSVSCSEARFEPPKVEFEFGSEAKIYPSSSSKCWSRAQGSPAVTL